MTRENECFKQWVSHHPNISGHRGRVFFFSLIQLTRHLTGWVPRQPFAVRQLGALSKKIVLHVKIIWANKVLPHTGPQNRESNSTLELIKICSSHQELQKCWWKHSLMLPLPNASVRRVRFHSEQAIKITQFTPTNSNPTLQSDFLTNLDAGGKWISKTANWPLSTFAGSEQHITARFRIKLAMNKCSRLITLKWNIAANFMLQILC